MKEYIVNSEIVTGGIYGNYSAGQTISQARYNLLQGIDKLRCSEKQPVNFDREEYDFKHENHKL